MKSAFAPFDERLLLINTVIKPGFATARALSNAQVPPHLRDAGAGGPEPRTRRSYIRGHALRHPERVECPSVITPIWPACFPPWLATSISVAPMMALPEASVHSTAVMPL